MSSLIEVKYNNADFLNTLKKKNFKEIKGISIASTRLFEEGVESYLKKMVKSDTMKIPNYIIDKESRIYKVLPDEYSGKNICNCDNYSPAASIKFPNHCHIIGGKSDIGPDDILESVLIETPNDILSIDQDKTLRDLILYIEGEYKLKYNVTLNESNIYLQRLFPLNRSISDGDLFFKKIDFMIFKRKIYKMIIGNANTDVYKINITKTDEIFL